MLIQILNQEIILYTLAMAFVLKIVVFILGFLTVRLGYLLIKDGATGSFTFSTETKGIKGALESGSPGLLFVLLGVCLIGYAIFVKKGVDINEIIETPTPGQTIQNSDNERNVDHKSPPALGSIDTTQVKKKG